MSLRRGEAAVCQALGWQEKSGEGKAYHRTLGGRSERNLGLVVRYSMYGFRWQQRL